MRKIFLFEKLDMRYVSLYVSKIHMSNYSRLFTYFGTPKVVLVRHLTKTVGDRGRDIQERGGGGGVRR